MRSLLLYEYMNEYQYMRKKILAWITASDIISNCALLRSGRDLRIRTYTWMENPRSPILHDYSRRVSEAALGHVSVGGPEGGS